MTDRVRREDSDMAGWALGPCSLEGEHLRLEPLRQEHGDALFGAALRMEWGWFLYPMRTRQDVAMRIDSALESERENEGYAFAVRMKQDERIVGSTSYLGVAAKHKRVEIGSTWYLPEVQGTVVNPECKYLLLKHAFEDWGAVRVQFTTDANNTHSQNAILKLRAKYEGKLRNHGIRPDGSARDAMVYSIVPNEWPEVKAGLLARIQTA